MRERLGGVGVKLRLVLAGLWLGEQVGVWERVGVDVKERLALKVGVDVAGPLGVAGGDGEPRRLKLHEALGDPLGDSVAV